MLLTYEDGIIFTKNILAVDEKQYREEIRNISRNALLLSLSIGYVNRETIRLLIDKAHRNAALIADVANIITKDNIGKLLLRSERIAQSLKSKLMTDESIKNKEDKVNSPEEGG